MNNTRKHESLESQIQLVQQGDADKQDYLLKAYQPFIAKSVSEVCKRYINRYRDDEFSIGLLAFNEAMKSFSPDKGSCFLSFARLVIKRKVIDYLRKERNRPQVISLEETRNEEENDYYTTEITAAKERYQWKTDEWCRREEINELSIELKAYKLSFEELTKVSPKHADARQSAIKVARMLYEDEQLKEYVLKKKKIPIKALTSLVDVSKKTLERNRKYILAMFIILDGEYIYLKEYLKGVGL